MASERTESSSAADSSSDEASAIDLSEIEAVSAVDSTESSQPTSEQSEAPRLPSDSESNDPPDPPESKDDGSLEELREILNGPDRERVEDLARLIGRSSGESGKGLGGASACCAFSVSPRAVLRARPCAGGCSKR